jgi:hypothetical protein
MLLIEHITASDMALETMAVLIATALALAVCVKKHLLSVLELVQIPEVVLWMRAGCDIWILVCAVTSRE